MSGREKQRKTTGERRLSKLLRSESVLLDLVVDDKADLLTALAEVVVPGAEEAAIEKICTAIDARESSVDTYVGDGVAIPMARVDCVDGIYLALARNRDGFPYGRETDQPVRLAVLVVGSEGMQSEHVQILSIVAGVLKDARLKEKILHAQDAATVRRLLDAAPQARSRKAHRLTQLLLSHARKIAREMGATAVMISVESREELKILKRLPRRGMFIVATSSRKLATEAEQLVSNVLLLPQVALRREARVRLTALMALAHGQVKRGDVVAFLSGGEGELIDTMTFLELGREFGRFFTASGSITSEVSPAVLERVIALATALGAEGREGKHIGAIFVIGDPEALEGHCQQMVMNPFRGYPPEECNILDPTLEETIKEFASIDGAFVVSGDGILNSAGTYLKSPKEVDLPGGYGSRHRAACGMTAVADCCAVTLSQSTGEVTVFHKGEIVLNLPQSRTR